MLRYTGNAITTVNSLSMASKEEVMNKWWQNKRHIWNNQRINKKELQQRNHLGTLGKKIVCVRACVRARVCMRRGRLAGVWGGGLYQF